VTMRPICVRCGRGSCPAVGGRFGVCPQAEVDELTAEWLALLTDPEGAPRLAKELAELAYNVRCLQRAAERGR
jgi:RNA polymerase subunit RPABC4/transcription elongation factor Spt4